MNKNILYTVIGLGVAGVVGYMIYKKRKKSSNEMASKKMIEDTDEQEESSEKVESTPSSLSSKTKVESTPSSLSSKTETPTTIKPKSPSGYELKSMGGIKKIIAVSKRTQRKPIQTTVVQYYPAKNRACKDGCNLKHPWNEDKRNNCKKECDKKYPIAPKSSFDGDGVTNFEPVSSFIQFEPFN